MGSACRLTSIKGIALLWSAPRGAVRTAGADSFFFDVTTLLILLTSVSKNYKLLLSNFG